MTTPKSSPRGSLELLTPRAQVDAKSFANPFAEDKDAAFTVKNPNAPRTGQARYKNDMVQRLGARLIGGLPAGKKFLDRREERAALKAAERQLAVALNAVANYRPVDAIAAIKKATNALQYVADGHGEKKDLVRRLCGAYMSSELPKPCHTARALEALKLELANLPKNSPTDIVISQMHFSVSAELVRRTTDALENSGMDFMAADGSLLSKLPDADARKLKELADGLVEMAKQYAPTAENLSGSPFTKKYLQAIKTHAHDDCAVRDARALVLLESPAIKSLNATRLKRLKDAVVLLKPTPPHVDAKLDLTSVSKQIDIAEKALSVKSKKPKANAQKAPSLVNVPGLDGKKTKADVQKITSRVTNLDLWEKIHDANEYLFELDRETILSADLDVLENVLAQISLVLPSEESPKALKALIVLGEHVMEAATQIEVKAANTVKTMEAMVSSEEAMDDVADEDAIATAIFGTNAQAMDAALIAADAQDLIDKLKEKSPDA